MSTRVARGWSNTGATGWMAAAGLLLACLWPQGAASVRGAATIQPEPSAWPIADQMGGSTQQVFVDGERLVHDVGPRLIVRDLEEPTGGTERWRSGWRRPAELWHVASGHAYFAEGAVLSAHRLADGMPRRSSLTLPGRPSFVKAGGTGRIVVAGRQDGTRLWLEIVDISQPDRLRSDGGWGAEVGAGVRWTGLSITAGWIHASTWHDGARRGEVLVFAADDPARIALVGTATRDTIRNPWLGVLTSKESRIVARVAGHLLVFDVSDPSAPHQVAAIELPREAVDAAFVGEVLYVVTGAKRYDVLSNDGGWVLAYDLADPAAPEERGRLHHPASLATALAVRGQHLYVAGEDQGLLVVEAADPARMRLAQVHVARPAAPVAVAAAGERVVVLDSTWSPTYLVEMGLDPDSRLVRRGTAEVAAHRVNRDLVLAERAAYFVEAARDPSAPKERLWRAELGGATGPVVAGTSVELEDHALDLATAEGLLVVARGEAVVVVDVARPGREAIVGRSESPRHWAIDVVLQGPFAYVLHAGDPDEAERIDVLDLSDPAHPATVGTVDVPPLGDGWFQRNELVAGDGWLVVHGQLVYALTDPTRPRLVGAFQLDGEPIVVVEDAAIHDGRLLVGRYDCLRVLDLALEPAPRQVGAFEVSVDALAATGPHAFATTRFGGLWHMRLDHPPLARFPEACAPFTWRPWYEVAPAARVFLPVGWAR